MKKLLITAFFCLTALFATNTALADNYHQLLKQSLEADLLSSDGELQQLIPLLQMGMGEQAGNMFAEYAQKQLADDVATMYEPVYKKYVSAEDLKWIIKWENDERNRAINKKVVEKTAAINQDQQVMQYLQELATGISNIVKGEPTSPLSQVECNDSYRKAFDQYIQSANLQEIMEQMMDGVIGQIARQNQMSVEQLAPQAKDKLTKYSFEATKNLCLLLLKDTLTEDDLLYVTKNTQTTEYKHLQKASVEIAANPDILGTGLFEGFYKWVEKNYPEQKDKVEKLKNR